MQQVGKYQLRKVLGKGASGTVYLALGTLPPGTYHIRAFAVTDSGVPLSNVVVTPTTVT